MLLDELLRKCVLEVNSIARVARESGIPQATLQEFTVGKGGGLYADLRLSSAQKLLEYFRISVKREGSRRMNLAIELKASGFSDSPEKFKERILDGLIEWFPGYTIDDLLCNPRDALEYCRKIREGIGTESLADVVILKCLLNLRKAKNLPTDLKSTRTRKSLKKELKRFECDLKDEVFRDLTADCFADMYKSRTIDELLCHPREAMMLCNYTRTRTSHSSIPDHLILSTILNGRKAPHS